MSIAKPPGVYMQRFAALVFFLIKAPRTKPELAQLLGVGEQDHGRVAYMLSALEDEGLVRAAGSRETTGGRTAVVWEWCGVPTEEGGAA